MGEERRRCRYWPNCEVHRGERRLVADVMLRERLAIVRECQEAPAEWVAQRHGLSRDQVRRLRRQLAGLEERDER